jgi:hypothetical protein
MGGALVAFAVFSGFTAKELYEKRLVVHLT